MHALGRVVCHKDYLSLKSIPVVVIELSFDAFSTSTVVTKQLERIIRIDRKSFDTDNGAAEECKYFKISSMIDLAYGSFLRSRKERPSLVLLFQYLVY
jgi:hypothetical protein